MSRRAPGGGPRLTRRDRLLAAVVTGPAGRAIAFVWDLAAAWWRWARGQGHPERTR